jgi:hypothetical protein
LTSVIFQTEFAKIARDLRNDRNGGIRPHFRQPERGLRSRHLRLPRQGGGSRDGLDPAASAPRGDLHRRRRHQRLPERPPEDGRDYRRGGIRPHRRHRLLRPRRHHLRRGQEQGDHQVQVVPSVSGRAREHPHPQIEDVAVVGKADRRFGEVAVGFIVKREGATLTEGQVCEFLAKFVSDEKRLHGGVRFVDVIPRINLGKISRRELIKRVQELQDEFKQNS